MSSRPRRSTQYVQGCPGCRMRIPSQKLGLQTFDPPASTSHALGLEFCTTKPERISASLSCSSRHFLLGDSRCFSTCVCQGGKASDSAVVACIVLRTERPWRSIYCVLSVLFETESYSRLASNNVAEAGLKLPVLLPLPPQCSDAGHASLQ